MKTLLFITFKILEVGLYLFFVCILDIVLEYFGLFGWMDNLNKAWVLIILISCLALLITSIIKIIPSWFAKNREWVNKILD